MFFLSLTLLPAHTLLNFPIFRYILIFKYAFPNALLSANEACLSSLELFVELE